jgi:hypothetical protein
MTNPETAKKCGITKRGIRFSEDHKRNISESNKGCCKPNFKGHQHSIISKSEISKSLSKKSYIVTSPDGKEYEVINLNRFCKDMKLNSSSMYFVAKGDWMQYKGYKAKIM